MTKSTTPSTLMVALYAERVREMCGDLMNNREICEELSIAVGTVAKLRKHLGLKSASKGRMRPKPPPITVDRKCLRCGRDFPSEHIGHRICDVCKRTEVWTSPSIDY